VSAIPAESARDECYRCGYDLRGIADDAACPECGLLAERSRRVTDELHDTRPRWLRSLSRGVDLILIAIVALFAGPFLQAVFAKELSWWWSLNLPLIGFDLAAICLFLGVILITRPEGYTPADLADHRLRRRLRMAAIPPLLMMGLLTEASDYILVPERAMDAVVLTFLVLFAFLPLLLFVHLRGLAGRARSAHLAEHCTIVGIGAFASTLYIAALFVVWNYADRWSLRTNWVSRSPVSLILMLVMAVASGLFILWSLYLLVRFAIAFWIAAGKLRNKWTRDDRSLTT
jgi:MFS family permease